MHHSGSTEGSSSGCAHAAAFWRFEQLELPNYSVTDYVRGTRNRGGEGTILTGIEEVLV